ncbi:MAG: hypothetical protein ABS41_03435 [Arenimonas sp. SCN 70-307]|uniref:TniQ family protein n=1 Tax=Arenimonas sp. SCN 70-307 TaxID=1660089 RepID=UPI00086C34B1|nr:TniQ family protein [Arenimonas sp. SCN 70-307]ODS64075.1 MAG: hypothetical protein ABS41_03435 [Arenimonas sp. SCN 70-307]
MKLVVTARPAPTESLMGFVLRLTELNGYPSTSYVLAAMGKEWYLPNVGRLDAAKLATLAGLDQGDINRLTHRPAERPRAYVRVYGSDLPSYEVNLRHSRVCPACLAEGRPCEAFWDLAQAAVCPVHQVHLASECPGCSKRLLWARSKVQQCKCGFDLATAPVAPATPALSELMSVLRSRVYQDQALAPLPQTMSHLAHLDLRRLCKLIWVMSGVVHQARGGRRAPKARCHYRDQLDVVAAALTNWPVGFRDFLSATYEDVLQNAEELPRFPTVFSWLLVRLIKNDEGERSGFEFLEREVYRFGAQYWTRGSMARDEDSQRLVPERVRWGTMGEACEATGLHQLTLKKRIASGEIKSRRIKKNSTRAIVVDLDSIRSLQLTQYPAVSMRDAAPRIGVSIETLKALRASGVIAEDYRSAFPGSLTHEDVEVFAERVRGLGTNRRALNDPSAVTLDDAFTAWTASPKEKAGVLARLLAHPTMVVGKKRGRGVGRLQVANDFLTDYFQSARHGAAECLPVLKTAERLGCTAAVVTWLKRGGHLKTKPRHGRQTPSLESVNAFHKKYEALARTAERLGVTAKSAYARLDYTGFDHVKVKTTQYTTVFIHRRHASEIRAVLSGR